MKSSRRELIKSAGAAAVLARFASVRAAAAATAPAASGASTVSRADYSLDPEVTYLNHASIGTVPRVVQEAHRGYLELCESNPWLYMWSQPWREPLEGVRTRAANLLGCESAEVAIVHNTTEFFNAMAAGLPLAAGDEVLFSSLNHAGASVCFSHRATTRGYAVRKFDFPLAGLDELTEDRIVARYEREIRPETRLLVIPHIDNQVGLRHPVARIAAMARDRGVRWVAVDGAQAVNMIPVDVAAMGVDIYVTSTHKWTQSPKGLGLAYVRRPIQRDIQPMWVTWGQKLWDDARVFEDYGTRALPAVLALGDALDFQAAVPMDRREAHHRRLWEKARQMVASTAGLSWRSPVEWSTSAALYAVAVEGGDSTEIAHHLFEQQGIVVRPFALDDLNALRISPNLANDEADLARLIEGIAALATRG